jgi:hypothetical protein
VRCVHTPNTGTCALRFVEAKKLVVEVKAAKPTQNRLTFLSKQSPTLPSAGNAPTERGAVLMIRDGSGQLLTADLPAEHWRALGKPNDAKGYKYVDRKRSSGPCSMVRMKAGNRIKAVCRGKGITISPPLTEQVEVTLRMGTLAYCAAFGGDFATNKSGSFVARGGLVPTTCPAGLEPPRRVVVGIR